ncbi:hypothetical protein Lal_00012501 [Lupinus albus]|nr:hypothetical protein Lal_00012501 [Lupinus albus]
MTADSTIPSQAAVASQNGHPRTKICVYCGAAPGASPAHIEAARALGRAMAENNIDLGESQREAVRLQPIPSRAANRRPPDMTSSWLTPDNSLWRRNCRTYGRGSGQFERDGTYGTVNEHNHIVPEESVYGRTTVVKDMHTRKKLMAEEVFAGGPGSGFIGLSGGFGTMEEIFETTTWNQLGIHNRGIVLLNIEGYWDGIVQWMDRASEEGFVKPANKNILVNADTPEGAIKALREYKVSDAIYQLQWGSQ